MVHPAGVAQPLSAIDIACGTILGLVVLYGIGALRLRWQGRRGPGGNRRGAAERRIAGR